MSYERWVREELPKSLPDNWRAVRGDNSKSIHYFKEEFFQGIIGLCVTVAGRRDEAGRRWLIVTVGRGDRPPRLEEIDRVKKMFVGEDRRAYVLFDSGAELNKTMAIDILACLDEGDPMPDFRNTLVTKKEEGVDNEDQVQ